MVTVVKTITEHTNGRRKKEDGSGWERRVGVERIDALPESKRKVPRTRVVWEDCDGPQTFVYGSPEHLAAREAGKGGGDVHYEWGGLDDVEVPGLLNEEAVDLLTGYAMRFGRWCYTANGGIYASSSRQASPTEAMQEARRIAKRVEELFGLDLWETNLTSG